MKESDDVQSHKGGPLLSGRAPSLDLYCSRPFSGGERLVLAKGVHLQTSRVEGNIRMMRAVHAANRLET